MDESQRDSNETDDFEALLAECIEGYAERGPGAVEEICSAHVDLAERLRSRLRELEQLGLLGSPEQGVPERMGSYRILRRIGQGGMSEVFLAHDERLDRTVALKSAHPGLALQSRASERFARECQAVSHLAHPGIVPVYDVGEAEGRAFFTMEYVEGATLAEVLDHLRKSAADVSTLDSSQLADFVRRVSTGTSSPPAARWERSYVELICRWTLEVAEALSHAHANGIVHRDVKPSNVMVRADGRVQLFDFGLARLEDQPALTRSGEFAGTPYYVSPDQLLGGRDQVDARTDVYSLGVTLYELLTLRRPFDGASTAEVLHRIQTQEAVPPRRLNARVPRDVELVCLTALDRDRSHRYPDMLAFAEDLQRLLTLEPVRARPLGLVPRTVRFVKRRPGVGALMGLATILLLGVPLALLWVNAKIRVERDAAVEAAAEARRSAALSQNVEEFLVDLFHLGRGESAELSARELLARGLASIPSGDEEEPLLRAALLETSARVYANLGMHDRALRPFDQAHALLLGELGDSHPKVAQVLLRLAKTHVVIGGAESARSIARSSVDTLVRAGLGDESLMADAYVALAEADAALENFDAAESSLRSALDLRIATSGPHSPGVAEIHGRLGKLAFANDDHERARMELERAIALRESAWSPAPLALMSERQSHAHVLAALGESAAASEEKARAELVANRERSWREHAAEPLPPLPFDFIPSWKARYDIVFQKGITAIQAGRPDLARESFLACLELQPRVAVCAYNLACANARDGRVDEGLDWMERAVDWGSSHTETALGHVAKDRDLDALRANPRFEVVLDRMRAIRAAMAERRRPACRLPEARDAAVPLIVVLHAAGKTPDDVLDGPWGRVAERAGFAMLAPKGPRPSSTDPERGADWFGDIEEAAERWPELERGVLDAFRVLPNDLELDRQRVWIAGEGASSPLAVKLALRYPGLFRGLMLLDGAPSRDTNRPDARLAALSGLEVVVIVREDAEVAWMREGTRPDALALGLKNWFDALGIECEAEIARSSEALEDLVLSALLAP